MNEKTLTAEQCSKLSLYILMTTKTREGEARTWEKLAEEKKGGRLPKYIHAADNAQFWRDRRRPPRNTAGFGGVSMDNFQSITASPEALAAFLGSIPAIETPWDEAFHRLCCSSCSAAGLRRLPPLGQDNPLWWLSLPAAGGREMNNLEKWLISIEPEKGYRGNPKESLLRCPAAEYCKNSPLNFCTEVLYAWAKEEAL